MKTTIYVVSGTLLLLFRIFIGSTRFGVEDAKQIYLIGLKYFTLGIYPYWGPDVVYSNSQIPGGLQGLLVGAPFHIWQSPWSPFILLNVLSMAALLFFAWYACKRLPQLPFPLVALWLLMSPWSLHYSTHIENPSYVLPVSILFFIAVFELLPIYKNTILPKWLSWGFIGFSITWIMQLHLSWVMLLPYAVTALFFQRYQLRPALALVAGAALPALAYLPLLELPPGIGATGGVEHNIVLNWSNLQQLPTIFARFFSYATYELLRFIGGNTVERLGFLQRNIWIAVPTVLVGLAGIGQWLFLVTLFFKPSANITWNKLRLLTGLSITALYCAFSFSITAPKAHTFVFLYPLAMWYALNTYCALTEKRWFVPGTIVFLICGAIFQWGLALENNRRWGLHLYENAIEKAFETHDYTFAGIRRIPDFEQKNSRFKYWTEMSCGETFLNFIKNNQPANTIFLPANIVYTPPYDLKKWCWKMDSTFQYGVHLVLNTGHITYSNTMKNLSLSFHSISKHPVQLRLVTEVRNGGKTDYWTSIPVEVPRDSSHCRTALSLETKQWLRPGGEMRTYLWLEHPKPDDLIYIYQAEYEIR